MKKSRKIILILTSCVLAASLLVGGFFTWRHFAADPVKVYPVSDLGYFDSWSFSESSGGSVRTDRMQTVYLSETQQVTDILVSEGQEVKQGDILLQFDSSLSELQLAKKELEIEQKERELKKAKEEYNSLVGYTAYTLSFSGSYRVVLLDDETEIETEPTELTEPTEPIDPPTPAVPALPGEMSEDGIVSSYFLVGGTGTKEHPYLYVIGNNIPFDDAFVSALLQNTRQAYVVFARCEENRYDGIVNNSWGICFDKNEDGSTAFSLFTTDGRLGLSLLDPDSRDEIEQTPPEDDPIIDPIGPIGPIGPSWEEIQQRKNELEKEIREGDIALRMLKVELTRMQRELGDGNVYAEFDGTVTFLGDPETAYAYGEPVIKLSGGGGYYIDGAISELALSSIQEGQTVQINAWESNTYCDGVVQSISTTPSPNYGWSNGNPNVTYYVYTVFVDGSYNLREGEWVDMSLSNTDSENAFVLDKAFVLQEAGKSFVYAQGKDGKLEKWEIKVGRDLYGSSVQILGGLTIDDLIAFPYSADVKIGAKTVKGTLDELYGW